MEKVKGKISIRKHRLGDRYELGQMIEFAETWSISITNRYFQKDSSGSGLDVYYRKLNCLHNNKQTEFCKKNMFLIKEISVVAIQYLEVTYNCTTSSQWKKILIFHWWKSWYKPNSHLLQCVNKGNCTPVTFLWKQTAHVKA